MLGLVNRKHGKRPLMPRRAWSVFAGASGFDVWGRDFAGVASNSGFHANIVGEFQRCGVLTALDLELQRGCFYGSSDVWGGSLLGAKQKSGRVFILKRCQPLAGG